MVSFPIYIERSEFANRTTISLAMAPARDSDPDSLCVECGKDSNRALYKEFSGGTIQLSQCAYCHKVLDKYVELDVVILLLDVLLLRIQSYRHLIFNYGISFSLLWKFSVVLVLCEAYTKLRMLKLTVLDSVLLQIQFHSLLLQSVGEFLGMLISSYVLIRIFVDVPERVSFRDIVRTLVISSFGKLCAIAAMVWTGDFYLWLPTLLVLPAQLQAFRALLRIATVQALAIILAECALMYGLSAVLSECRAQALQQLGLVTT